MTGLPTGFRPDSTESDRNARPEPTGFPYRGEPAVGENRSVRDGAEQGPFAEPFRIAHARPRASYSKVFARAKTRAKALLMNRAKAAPGRVPCGARRRRDGKPCEALSVPGKRRCKWHGGCSTGPKTPEGKAKAAANLRKRRNTAGLAKGEAE